MALSKSEWLQRCASRIVELDAGLSPDDAQELAQELYAFERTRALEPENAVDFVATELGRGTPRFERRTAPRPDAPKTDP